MRSTPCVTVLAFLTLVPAGANAQQSAVATGTTASRPATCAEEPHRAFDFWVGSWVVQDSAGNVLGQNEIQPIAGDCGLLESWRGASGGTGRSLNFYDPGTGRWNQVWVGAGAVFLRLEGGLEDGAMVMEGERSTPAGPVLDRIRWIPQSGGRVLQEWLTSADGGGTWNTIFRGTYVPADGA